MRRPAIAVETIRIGIGAKTEIMEAADSAFLESHGDEARQIEHGVSGTSGWHEEARIFFVLADELIDEILTDLIIRLPDQRTQRNFDTATSGSELFHFGDCVLDD